MGGGKVFVVELDGAGVRGTGCDLVEGGANAEF